jgi:hypothetical protein
MTREEAMELLIAISQIEGYVIGVTGLNRPSVVYDNMGIIISKLVEIVKGPK